MNREILKYLIAGGLAFICDFSILWASTEILGFHYLISNTMGYTVGMLVAYTLNTRWVFSHRRYENQTRRELILFNVIVLCGLAFSEVVMALLVEGMAMHYLWAKFVASVLVVGFNYAAKKYFLFRP